MDMNGLQIITHLMKRLYAEGTLCLFSGAEQDNFMRIQIIY